MQTENVLDVSEATFEEEVLRRSEQTPVVVDFWADWCGPCTQLSPVLEHLAGHANGSWILAKIDVDANPNLAAAFGVQGIPAVHAFRNGREVSRFVGALPEQQVREWLTQLDPTPADLAVEEARAAEDRKDFARAAEAYRRALAHEPANADATAGLARAELALRTAALDEDALRARADADPADVEAASALADLEFARGDVDGAADRLIAVIRAADGDARDQARARLVGLLDTLPVDDPRALRARRELANALY
ncbi:MAG: thioredoxin [Actinomycetota bacterium]